MKMNFEVLCSNFAELLPFWGGILQFIRFLCVHYLSVAAFFLGVVFLCFRCST